MKSYIFNGATIYKRIVFIYDYFTFFIEEALHQFLHQRNLVHPYV